MVSLLEPAEIVRIERQFATGIPARAIVEVFKPYGVRLSEGTFRKYVQAGLLPHSRRVGQKGKHRGSTGVYPVSAIRRINVIKRMMDEGLTLSDIRRSFVYFRNEIDAVEAALQRVQTDFGRELSARPLAKGRRQRLARALIEARAEAQRLIRSLEQIASEIVAAGTPVAPAANLFFAASEG
jgi:DNA-binding transcriptional MerR regulator